MFHGGISTIFFFFLFSMITSTLMMVQEASNLWNGFGAHSRHSKSSQGSLATPFFIRFERFMLCKQLGSKDLSVSLWIKLKELTLLWWTMNSKNDSPRCDLFASQTEKVFYLVCLQIVYCMHFILCIWPQQNEPRTWVGLFCLGIAILPIYWRFSVVLLLFVKVGDFIGVSTDLGSKHVWVHNGVI